MIVTKWRWLLYFLLYDVCFGWLYERPTLESINGNLYISSSKDKNITLKTIGAGNININDINLLHAVWAAQNASRLIERWRLGVLEDIEATIQRLTRIVEGPNGLVRKINLIESNGDPSANISNTNRPYAPDTETTSITAVQVRAIGNRLRRLERKVREITVELRTNECASDPCQNGGTCIDRYDSFQCHCPPEWEGPLCAIDVNECERLAGKPSGCQNGATCVNLPGSFSCTCPPGWHGFHCSTQKSACDQSNDMELCGNGVCIKSSSPLGYTCICKMGWDHLGENDPSCRKDIDECTTSRYPCSVNPLVTCHNVPGTFYCGVCPVGYTGDGFKCQDIDECQVANGGCSTTPFVECINTLGSRRCGPCPNGFQGDGITCFYVGSCTVNNGGCHSLATCREGPNSETFCLCPSGYQGNGKGPQGCTPTDNPCKNNPCVHGTCSVTGDNNILCTCNDGYTGPRCNTAVSPCSPNPCQNNGICRITPRGRQFCECTASFSGRTCSTPKPTCGGFFKSSVGYVEFPVGTGNKYDHGLSCAWVILTNQTMVLNVTFTKFALEFSHGIDECKHDYVQIHDGRSAGSHIFGRYCGNELPNNGTIISTHNSLYIWFHSDSTINSDGFAFNWTTIEPICGGEINEEYGAISSPGYPGKYPTNRDCYWNINVQPGKRIALHFISLMLEEHPICSYDYLEVNETNFAGQHQLGLFCNHSRPAPITTSGSHATVHFHSDNSGTDSGFHLSFLSIAGAPDCGGIFTSESGEIISPGYHSGRYRDNLICEWEIRLPENSRISIKWLNFDIEQSRNCKFDSLQIYQGPDTNSPLVGRYCGSNLPETLSINSNRILIRFESDESLEEEGFVLKYNVECGGRFTEPSGILKSPYYPNYYPASKDCVYLISQKPGKAIVLTFEFMDIEEGTTIYNDTQCYFDRLEIRDGDSQNSTLLTTLCGTTHQMPRQPIYSTQNYMYIEFHTDASIHNLGFKANYTTIDRECGGILKDAPGTLVMPGLATKYNYRVDCVWTIRAPPNFAIQLTWLTFPNQQFSVNEECGRNNIELIEGYGTDDPKSLGKYCPIKEPPQIITTQGNDLTLHYRFTGDISEINYQATYVFVNDTHNCGGHYYAETGYIRTPNFPENYPNNKECVWVIEARNKYLITLVFNTFDLEGATSERCDYDYVEIRSGSQESSPLIGRFCGDKMEDEITSMTNQMYIKFVSDPSMRHKGFDLDWHTTKTGCGGSLRSSSGAIISPNYPQNYYHRASCTWNVRVAAGSAIVITFIDFDLEDHVKCSFDYLEISDIINGYKQNTRRYCGSTEPTFFLSKSNQVKLTFRTDLLTASRGFHLKYTTECHNAVTGFQGVIESPNFPGYYGALNNCSWTISVPTGNKINMTFSHFNIDNTGDKKCEKDYLRIQEGDNDEPAMELFKKCGHEEDVLPLKISSTQHQVFVSFISDRWANDGSFRLEWYVNGCSKHYTKPNGIISSPGYPNGDRLPEPSIKCEWLIEVAFDKSIEIQFLEIENTKTHTCRSDDEGSIEIYNGQNENAPKIISGLCYSDKPVIFTSTGNQMLIKYSSEKYYASHGFIASYRSIGIKCGGRFTSQSGVIHSANYPKNYPHNQNCEWLIVVDSNHAVNLTFLDLDLELSKNCSDDYINIYDGSTKEAPLLGTHCKISEALPYYVSSGNQLLVTMRTDSLVSAKGFKAEYNRTCGARILVDGQGALRSSPTLHTMSAVNCSWILTAEDPGDKVTLTFTHLDIMQAEDDCSFNHIEIYEGEGTDGPLLGQICTNKLPTPFFSTGNSLTVHMTSSYGHTVGDTFDATYSTFSSACGGTYTAESGSLASPNYPFSYPSKSQCTWIIKNSPGNKVSLSFDDFELLNSENCITDYVEVRENSGIGKLRGVYCGNNATSIDSSQPLWIRFKSGSTNIGNPKGFRAEYHLLFGDELSGDFGEIASPMYPLPYRRSNTFSWRITVDFHYVIKIQFLDFNLDNWSLDYEEYCISSLRIYDGYNNEAPEIKELCGITLPKDPIISTGNIMYIQMETSFDDVGNWFHLKWIKIPKSDNEAKLEEIVNSENSKMIILTDQNTTYSFNSPGYPEGYGDNLKYSWTIVSPVGTHLVLRFLVMNIEESDDCVLDYVAIYKGYVTSFDSTENLIKKVCLSNVTTTNFVSTNVMTVQFITDSYRNQTGFSAIALTECGGTIEESSGVILVNNSMHQRTPRQFIYSCEWVVKVKTGRRISVKVMENRMETSQPKTSDNSCKSNYLMLKNGESSSSPLLGTGKYCNGVKPPIQNTSSNYLYVKLAVSFATVNFKLVFRELGHDCGGQLIVSSKTDSQQEITSPNYPNIPTPHIECIWTLMSADEHRLSIHFLDRFDLAYSEECEKEYVEIRDGGTDSSPLIGRYCKTTPPSSLMTKGNLMYVRYYTDLPEPRNGFKAVITTDDVCSGIARESHGGVITSPNYPDSYDSKNQICQWWIIAPSASRSITIQFEDIELPVRRNCSETDHVTIYDKEPGSFNNTEVGTYCGRKNPGVIQVPSSEAMVIFHSSYTNSRLTFNNRFRLNYTFSYNGCGNILTGMSGVFQSDGYPRVTKFMNCKWKIIVPEGFQVVLDIQELDFDEVSYLVGSHVTFFNDDDYISPITMLRRSTPPIRISSSSNLMSIYYISSGGHRGMKAKYFAQAPAPCGGILNEWENVVMSPQSEPFNRSAFYCKWIVKPPEDIDSVQTTPLTLSISVSGLINRGRGTLTCLSFIGNVYIAGDEPVAKVCGDLTKDPVTVASPFKSYTIQAINATNRATVNFTLKANWHRCGGILMGPSHIIQTPQNISSPAHCAWKVRYPSVDNPILIHFEKMNLGPCDKTYILVKGKTYRSPHLGKFCGNVKPADIVSPTNEVMIEYYVADGSSNYDFEIHLNPAEYACGGIVKGKRSELRSPGFPENYPSNTECIWEIQANTGYHVGFSFVERFNLEPSINCENDFVEVFEWSDEIQINSTENWKSLGKACGRNPPLTPYNSTNNRMMVKFVSNDKIEGEGFKGVWSQNCGGVFRVTEAVKYIESPNFPSLYPSKTICNYTLTAPDEQEIIVDFTNFVLEGNSAACIYDNITMHFYSGEWLRGKSTFCGLISPGRKKSKGRMEIIFISDSSVNRSGFKFKYYLNDCGGTITSPRIINPIMHDDPDEFEYLNCVWVIQAPPKKSVLVRFEQFNISQTLGRCLSDSVRVYEGNSTADKNLKATFCGNLHKNLPVIQSINNTMTINFRVGVYGQNEHSMKAAVLFVNSPETGCGGNVNLTNTAQFKTQATENYEPLQDCHWLINAPPGHNIQFTINEIDLKNSSYNFTAVNKRMSCNSDYLQIRDGGPYSEIIGHFCGDKVPAPITSTSNLLWVRFVSDGVNEGRGVKGTLRTVTSPCGVTDLTVGNESQILTSPNYPDAYPSDITCRWIIRSETGRFKRIRLTFDYFTLDDSEKCETEYLKISDMDNREVISEGFGEQLIVGGARSRHTNVVTSSRFPQSFFKYCGDDLPHDYFSNYKGVEITYKATSDQLKKKGFKLEYSKASCSRNYTALQGRIIHEDITECWVTIQVPENYTINMYFNNFYLPGSNDCSKSNMQIREGGFDGHLIQSVCNYETPPPVFSTGNRISIHVITDKNRKISNAYDITYTATDVGRGCGGQLYNYGGIFTSPLYPNSYRNESTCVWDVSVPKGMKISLQFNVFDIGPKSLCESDYLIVTEIMPVDSDRSSMTYCGGDTPADFNAQSNRVLVTYKTSVNNGGSGWLIHFAAM